MNTQIKIKAAQHNLKKWWIAHGKLCLVWSILMLLLIVFIAAVLGVVS